MGCFPYTSTLAIALAIAANKAGAFTIGSPPGLAANTTGGAGGEVVYPSSNAELIAYLNDTRPFIVVLNQTFDFRGTEGTTTGIGCRPIKARRCLEMNNGFKGKDVIVQAGGMANTGGCTNGTEVTVTYDNAAIKRLNVKDNKTIRGIGKKGVIIGKGLSIRDNIIVQNIHITELNSHLVWGGDAIFLQGSNAGTVVGYNVWIDHVKVSRIGRQMVVTNKAGVDSMTISNSDFDGRTEFSSTCDGHHYWTFLFYGKNTVISMVNNYVHGTSGRSPKVGGTEDSNVVLHAANNYWGDNTGHSYEIGINAYVLAEGNYFVNTNRTLDRSTDGALYAFNSTDDDGACTSILGRPCEANVVVNSSSVTSRNGNLVLEAMKAHPKIINYSLESKTNSGDEEQQQVYQFDLTEKAATPTLIQASELAEVWAETTGNFGVGKLD
uniref:pectin lyase n=1 Tax=Hyaloperonospora arabidopsidis (strain Emoy2) TaxID=559515 RepID=M4C115_HYAAE